MVIEEAQFPEPWTRSMLLDEIRRTDTRRYTVAEEGRALVGYLGMMFIAGEAHVNTIGTAPGHEGRGIATTLLTDAWRDAHKRGITRVSLEVAVSNVRAQALYRRFGFAPVGVRRNYYERTGEDALVLWAEIGDGPTPTL